MIIPVHDIDAAATFYAALAGCTWGARVHRPPLLQVRERAIAAGAKPDTQRGEIGFRPWAERSFYVTDPYSAVELRYRLGFSPRSAR